MEQCSARLRCSSAGKTTQRDNSARFNLGFSLAKPRLWLRFTKFLGNVFARRRVACVTEVRRSCAGRRQKTRAREYGASWKCRNAFGVMFQAKRLSRNYANALVALSFVNREVYQFPRRRAASYCISPLNANTESPFAGISSYHFIVNMCVSRVARNVHRKLEMDR